MSRFKRIKERLFRKPTIQRLKDGEKAYTASAILVLFIGSYPLLKGDVKTFPLSLAVFAVNLVFSLACKVERLEMELKKHEN
jgi:hypothetical protein